MDYGRLNAQLLARAGSLLAEWLPGGRRVGNEWVCGSLAGGAGQSCSTNLTTGVGRDYASGEKGWGDLIALYATIHSLSQNGAALELEKRYFAGSHAILPIAAGKEHAERSAFRPVKPNGAQGAFAGEHPRHGLPAHLFAYRNLQGDLLFYIARYHTSAGKTFAPWTYDGHAWRAKSWPAPRPLYNLPALKDPALPVLIVEGELKADLAQRQLPGWAVLSWCGGAAAVQTADWNELKGRQVTIWPDADDAGARAGERIAELLTPVAGSVRVLQIQNKATGWDVADFIGEGGNPEQFIREHSPSHPLALPRFQHEQDCWRHFQLDLGPGSRPWANLSNILKVLAEHPQTKGRFWFDAFRARVMCDKEVWRDEKDAADLTVLLQRELGMHRVTVPQVVEAVRAYALREERHPVREWLSQLAPWDRIERLAHLLADAFGTVQDDYFAAVGRNFLVGAIARVMNPGCQLDYMPVFESAQGTGKQNALRALFDPWYRTAHTAAMDRKDFFIELRGAWVLELAEMDQVMRSTIERVKTVLTIRVDEYRPPYGREVHSFPRQCVFAGSTNSSQWMADETGARRFWPVAHPHVNLEYLTANRAQLWAEALHRFRGGESYWEIPEQRAAEEQEARFTADPWEEAIGTMLASRTEITVPTVLEQLGVKADKWDLILARRVGRTLRHLGWTPRPRREGKRVYKVFMPSSKPQ